MAITAGFGLQMDLKRGTMRRWYSKLDGVKRWADNDQPCEPPCDRGACKDFSPGPCDNPDCAARAAINNANGQ
ncbi:hypothetical protein [Ottowia sp. VDI28]|uniref:hypothetical protein n=1 Tax=Ottowia sp. VDI28 TaxID=3133968 RepID=UPI003C2DBF33